MAAPKLAETVPTPAAVVHHTMATSELPSFFDRAFGAVAAAAAAQGVELVGEPFAFYPGAPTDVIEVAAGFRVSTTFQPAGEVVPMDLPGGRVVIAVHVGPYDTMDKTYKAIHTWMATRRLTPAGHMWEIYLSDPGTEPDPSAWRTQIVWPVND